MRLIVIVFSFLWTISTATNATLKNKEEDWESLIDQLKEVIFDSTLEIDDYVTSLHIEETENGFKQNISQNLDTILEIIEKLKNRTDIIVKNSTVGIHLQSKCYFQTSDRVNSLQVNFEPRAKECFDAAIHSIPDIFANLWDLKGDLLDMKPILKRIIPDCIEEDVQEAYHCVQKTITMREDQIAIIKASIPEAIEDAKTRADLIVENEVKCIQAVQQKLAKEVKKITATLILCLNE